MTTTQWIAVASVTAVVVSAFAIVAALKGVRDQLRVTIFLTYTERYAKIMNGLPFEARRPGSKYQLNLQPKDERDRVLSAFREYFNLCSEEMWLYAHRRIDRATWRIWERGIQQVARFPSFWDAWEFLACEYDYYEKFQEFVNERVLQHAQGSGSGHESGPTSVVTTRENLPAPRRGWALHVRFPWERGLAEGNDAVLTKSLKKDRPAGSRPLHRRSMLGTGGDQTVAISPPAPRRQITVDPGIAVIAVAAYRAGSAHAASRSVLKCTGTLALGTRSRRMCNYRSSSAHDSLTAWSQSGFRNET